MSDSLLNTLERASTPARFLLPGIFLLALVLRLIFINSYSLWGDEVESIEVASKGLSFIFDSRFGWAGNQTVGHYLLTWLMLQPLDPTTSAFFVRLPSALAGAFLPLATYGLTRELFNKNSALLAAAITALSPIMLDYSHDVRPYAILALLTTTSFYCLLKAEKSNAPLWWIAFTLTSVLNVLNSNIAITIVLPSLSLAFALILWRIWSRRKSEGLGRVYYFVAAFAILGIASFLMLLTLLGSQRASPDWSLLSLNSIVHVLVITALLPFSYVGTSGFFTWLIFLTFMLFTLVGAFLAVRHNYATGAAICFSVILIAAFILAILDTASIVVARYSLFLGPFQYALFSAGIMLLFQKQPTSTATGSDLSPAKTRPYAPQVASVMVGVTLVVFAFGTFNYIQPETHSRMSYRPAFREAAKYLSQVAQPTDTIILADDPPLGYSVMSFYTHNQSQLAMFSMRDPTLYSRTANGSIYWVVSSINGDLVSKLILSKPDWEQVTNLEGLTILKEDVQGTPMPDVVNAMATRLDSIAHGYQPVTSLMGAIAEARKDIPQATNYYKASGVYFPIGGEYARTAEGFARQGFLDDAWKQVLVAAFMEPARPETHQLMSEYLAQMGHPTESANELAISKALLP